MLVIATWSLLHVGWYTRDQITDTGLYQTYGDRVVQAHRVPYRDFQLEYPPAALPVFVVPATLERFTYQRVFQALMALCAVAAAVAVSDLAGRSAAVVAAVAPLALGSIVLSRFDFWPVALAALGLAAVVDRRLVLSALLVGTAFAAKLWPALLVPFVVVWLARTGGARAAGRWLAATTAVAAAWFLPFVALSPGGVAHSFHAQFARPLQIESLGSSILIALRSVDGSRVHELDGFGSQNLVAAGAHATEVATTIAGTLGVVAVFVVFLRGPATVQRLLTACAAAVAVTIAFGKVFSPQFLIWLIPFVPLVRGRRRVPALVLFGAALVLTQLWFPIHYWDLVAFRSPYIWFLLARDVIVVALAATLMRALLDDDRSDVVATTPANSRRAALRRLAQQP